MKKIKNIINGKKYLFLNQNKYIYIKIIIIKYNNIFYKINL